MSSIGRNQTKERILSLIYRKKQLTKQDIAKEMNVSIPTVISNVNELLQEGIVEESGVADSTGGRKPVIVTFLPNSRFTFGVDINPEKARVILTNLDLDIKYDEEFLISGLKDMGIIMREVVKIIENALKVTGVERNKILGIGFSLPGTVNEEKRLLELAPNIGVRNVDFKKFEEYFNMPMFIENEANAAALAELNVGLVKDKEDLVYISITSGVGTGIIVKGLLYKGKNKRAGEFGHMTLVPNGKQCGCGRNGCWELYASQRALLEGFNEISNMKINNLSVFFQALKVGDEIAIEYFDKYLNILAAGIQNIELALDPRYIVLGGEISEYSELFMEDLKKKIFIENSFYDKNDLKLMASKLKKNSSIIGAALLPIKSAFFMKDEIL